MTTLADAPAGGATASPSHRRPPRHRPPERPAHRRRHHRRTWRAATRGRPGPGRPCWSCSPRPRCSTCGGWVRPGWANSFYSAAAQAGSESWKAFFFASSDSASSITVDKTPASVWVMALSVRLFGLSSWSILVPQALMGVASVALLHATVRRWHGDAAALVAGAVAAVTPVAVLMFRFNNPDALLVLSLVAAAYATVRAVETASIRWLSLAGALVGLGFMTKMLQALLVVPALALVWLVAAADARCAAG